MPSNPDVSVVDSIAANSTYENDGPVEVMNNVGEGALASVCLTCLSRSCARYLVSR